MAHVDAVPPSGPVDPPSKASSPPRALVVVAILVLLAFIHVKGKELWSEWKDLRGELTVVRNTVVVGYVNIHPNFSFAARPENWFHHEGETTLLWSGWKQGRGHQWFRVTRGEIDQERMSLPLGRDVIQAIDYPIVESQGGKIWKRIPDDASVVGLDLAGVKSVYPVLVLGKVGVINDTIGDRPVLLAFNPFVAMERSVHVYDAMVEGRRVTMGFSGHFQDSKPLLYDRGTESLWKVQDDGWLESVAGFYKGRRLRPLGTPRLTSWRDWRHQFPRSRLLVGADRTKTLPTL